MITLLICLGLLIVGYVFYGGVVDRILTPNDDVATPAKRMSDGVDYVELPWWKVFLTQFLNIAGVGSDFWGCFRCDVWSCSVYLDNFRQYFYRRCP